MASENMFWSRNPSGLLNQKMEKPVDYLDVQREIES
jgi:hypothetical protein